MAILSNEQIGDDPLVRQFRQFHDGLERARMQAPLAASADDAQTVARQVARQLENLIELQTLEARREGNRYALQAVQQARYLKAALADEVLLQREWSARDIWEQHLLEASLYRTSVAGEKIFSDIEELLRDREPSQRSLARLYLFALALGFRGKYRGQDADEELAALRRELFQFAFLRPADLDGRDRVLAQQPYSATLSNIAPRRIAPVSRWSVIFILGLVSLVALSELLWLWPTWSLRQHLNSQGVVAVEASK